MLESRSSGIEGYRHRHGLNMLELSREMTRAQIDNTFDIITIKLLRLKL